MVPLGGTKIVLVSNAGAVSSVTANNPNIVRPVLRGGGVALTGIARGTTLVKVRDVSGRVLARLDVTVKRKKTVRTKFWLVQDKNGKGRATARSQSDVDAALPIMNDIWLPQANVEFTQRGTAEAKVYKQDFGDEVRFTAHLPKVPLKEHEWDIVVAKRDFGADFNVFFVWEYEDNIDAGDGVDAGTLAFQKSALVEDSLSGHGLGRTLAHEAGHNMGLPDDATVPLNLMISAGGDLDKRLSRAQIDRVNP
jgi:hypothetical protein